jgi:hypothetical protein
MEMERFSCGTHERRWARRASRSERPQISGQSMQHHWIARRQCREHLPPRPGAGEHRFGHLVLGIPGQFTEMPEGDRDLAQ